MFVNALLVYIFSIFVIQVVFMARSCMPEYDQFIVILENPKTRGWLLFPVVNSVIAVALTLDLVRRLYKLTRIKF